MTIFLSWYYFTDLLYKVSHSQQFSALWTHKQQLLLHRLSCCVPVDVFKKKNNLLKKVSLSGYFQKGHSWIFSHKPEFRALQTWKSVQWYKTKLYSRKAVIPLTNVDRDEIVEVQSTPLLYVCAEGGAKESPANFRTRAGQENGGELLSETRFAILKELIWFIDHQPFHSEYNTDLINVHTRDISEYDGAHWLRKNGQKEYKNS